MPVLDHILETMLTIQGEVIDTYALQWGKQIFGMQNLHL